MSESDFHNKVYDSNGARLCGIIMYAHPWGYFPPMPKGVDIIHNIGRNTTPKNIYSTQIWAVFAFYKISTSFPRGRSRVLPSQCLFPHVQFGRNFSSRLNLYGEDAQTHIQFY